MAFFERKKTHRDKNCSAGPDSPGTDRGATRKTANACKTRLIRAVQKEPAQAWFPRFQRN